jgi:hypothetical protein
VNQLTSPQWLPRCQFYLRRLLQTQPIAFSAVLAAGAVIVCALALYLEQLHRADTAQEEWRTLNQHGKELSKAGVQSGDVKLALPVFNNTQLVEALNGAAESSKLSLDEISFLLDDTANQPYLRYHATLTVSSSYPVIRRFLDQVRVKQAEMSLDSITCTRDDITTVELTCDLAISAFYRKEVHG